MENLRTALDRYENSAAHNDALWTQFTALTDTDPTLREHRDHVERHKLGFGDRAFHYMWKLLLEDLASRNRPLRALEIGVYKGQVISLWALLARGLDLDLDIHAISPLEGERKVGSIAERGRISRLRRRVDPGYRRRQHEGNRYDVADYRQIIGEHFAHHGLDLDDVSLYKGFSSDPEIVAALASMRIDLIYVDGDHSFDGVISDLDHYATLLADDGYLVMDDASFFLEGDAFWKGHEAVSRAAETLAERGFANVMNVGHNRVYTRELVIG